MRGLDPLGKAAVDAARPQALLRAPGSRSATGEQAPTAIRAAATRPSATSTVAAAMAMEITR